jgi:hypothetical protein
MMFVAKWLLRNCPNLMLAMAGLWLAVLVVWFDVRFTNLICNYRPQGLEGIGYDLRLRLSWAEPWAFMVGLIAASVGCVRMVAGWETAWRPHSQPTGEETE